MLFDCSKSFLFLQKILRPALSSPNIGLSPTLVLAPDQAGPSLLHSHPAKLTNCSPSPKTHCSGVTPRFTDFTFLFHAKRFPDALGKVSYVVDPFLLLFEARLGY